MLKKLIIPLWYGYGKYLLKIIPEHCIDTASSIE